MLLIFIFRTFTKIKKFNLKVVPTDKKYNWYSSDEHEIEVIPTKDNSSYVLARSIYGNIEKDWQFRFTRFSQYPR